MAATSWYNDPQTWAALASIAGAYAQNTKKGDIRFKPVPQTPEELAAYNYAATLAGIPNPDGTSRGGAMPSMSYVGPQIQNSLQNYNSLFADYKPLNYLDPATGKEVPRNTTPFQPFDFSKVVLPGSNQPAAKQYAAGSSPIPGQLTAAQYNWNGQGTPPWTLNDGGSGALSSSDRKERLPNVYGDTNALLGMNGYEAWRGPGIDTAGLRSAWDRVPDAVRRGGLSAVVSFIAGGLGIPPAAVALGMRGANYIYDWYRQQGVPATPPPATGYNPTMPNGGGV